MKSCRLEERHTSGHPMPHSSERNPAFERVGHQRCQPRSLSVTVAEGFMLVFPRRA